MRYRERDPIGERPAGPSHQRISQHLAILTALMLASPAICSETIIYTYDAQGRLVSSVHTGTVNDNVQVNYAFDNANNRTNLTIVNAFNRVIVVPLNGFTVIPIPDP